MWPLCRATPGQPSTICALLIAAARQPEARVPNLRFDYHCGAASAGPPVRWQVNVRPPARTLHEYTIPRADALPRLAGGRARSASKTQALGLCVSELRASYGETSVKDMVLSVFCRGTLAGTQSQAADLAALAQPEEIDLSSLPGNLYCLSD